MLEINLKMFSFSRKKRLVELYSVSFLKQNQNFFNHFNTASNQIKR